MTNPTVGKVLKFTMPDNKDRFVLAIIFGDKISFYTGLESIGDLEFGFGEQYNGDSNTKIRNNVDDLYCAGYFHWAWHTLDGERVEEELMKRYFEENNDSLIIFDDWVKFNCNIANLKGGN